MQNNLQETDLIWCFDSILTISFVDPFLVSLRNNICLNKEMDISASAQALGTLLCTINDKYRSIKVIGN